MAKGGMPRPRGRGLTELPGTVRRSHSWHMRRLAVQVPFFCACARPCCTGGADIPGAVLEDRRPRGQDWRTRQCTLDQGRRRRSALQCRIECLWSWTPVFGETSVGMADPAQVVHRASRQAVSILGFRNMHVVHAGSCGRMNGARTDGYGVRRGAGRLKTMFLNSNLEISCMRPPALAVEQADDPNVL